MCMRREGAIADWQAGRGQELTVNMSRMSVTLDMLKLSSCSKASASCRGLQAGHSVRGELRACVASDGGGAVHARRV